MFDSISYGINVRKVVFEMELGYDLKINYEKKYSPLFWRGSRILAKLLPKPPNELDPPNELGPLPKSFSNES